MKKIKLLYVLMLSAFVIAPAYSYTSECDTSMCPSVPSVNGPVSSVLSTVTGMNFLISTTLESQVRHQLNKALGGDFKVDITPFGARSMLQGKFKKITAHSDTASVEGFYLSNINAESLCGYNHFVYNNGEVFTNENFLLSFSADITSDDLQKIVSTPQYTKLLNSMNVNVGNITMFKVFDPKAQVKDNKLVFSLRVFAPLAMKEPKLISTEMGLYVRDGQIMFSDMKFNPCMPTVNMNTVLPLFNKLNPFTYKANIMNNSKSIIKIQDVDFENDKIIIKGLVIVPKNYYNN